MYGRTSSRRQIGERRQGELIEYKVLIQILNKRGPKLLPWGTPERTRNCSDEMPNNLKNWQRSLRSLYYLNNCI